MILSHLHYCIIFWSQATKTVLRPIEVLYKQALKVMDRKSLKHHHCNILSKYKLLSFDSLVLLSGVRFVFRIIYNATTPPLRSFFQLRREQHSRSALKICTKCRYNRPSEAHCLCTICIFIYRQLILSNQSCQHDWFFNFNCIVILYFNCTMYYFIDLYLNHVL